MQLAANAAFDQRPSRPWTNGRNWRRVKRTAQLRARTSEFDPERKWCLVAGLSSSIRRADNVGFEIIQIFSWQICCFSVPELIAQRINYCPISY
jgi:hypothetical protein